MSCLELEEAVEKLDGWMELSKVCLPGPHEKSTLKKTFNSNIEVKMS